MSVDYLPPLPTLVAEVAVILLVYLISLVAFSPRLALVWADGGILEAVPVVDALTPD